jgi:hypothetical protein
MSLHVYEDLQQGTEEWLQARCGLLTASTVGQLITPSTVKPAHNDRSRGLTMRLLAERITGHVQPTFQTEDMLRGVLEEPIIRSLYASVNGVTVDQVGFMRDDDLHLGYSPDGLIGDDGLLEIKSRRPEKHIATVLSGEVPPENMAQLQAGLLVSGREWIDFVSFCGGLPLWTRRVTPDPRWFDAITAAAETFEQTAKAMADDWAHTTLGLPPTEPTHVLDAAEELTF